MMLAKLNIVIKLYCEAQPFGKTPHRESLDGLRIDAEKYSKPPKGELKPGMEVDAGSRPTIETINRVEIGPREQICRALAGIG